MKYLIKISILLAFFFIGQNSFAQNIDYYNQGINYSNKCQYNKALESFKKAIKLNPNDSKTKIALSITYYNVSSSYIDQYKFDEAIQYLNNAIKLNPNFSKAKENLGVAYSNKASILAANGNYQEAINNYNKALAIGYNKPVILQNLELAHTKLNQSINNNFTIANNYYDKKDYKTAIEYYKKALQTEQNNVEIYTKLANSYFLSQDYENSLKNYEKVAQLTPKKLDSSRLDFLNKLRDKVYVTRVEELSKKLNTLTLKEKAPQSIYNLVNFESGLKQNSNLKTYEILDYIWNDEEGKHLLKTLAEHNIKINILNGNKMASTDTDYSRSKNKALKTEINFYESTVQSFKDNSKSDIYTMAALRTFIHEFCHAVAGLNPVYKEKTNSIEEELCINMIVDNITFRLSRGYGLSEDETKYFSKRNLIDILSDYHAELPVYNGFYSEITKIYEIQPPNYNLYKDILTLYKEIRNQDNINKNNSLEKTLTSQT
ncbi:MAG: hypothetical protein A2104_09200 [Candidatus Melainabacteria bacterium GWF2_32_7]|nr:MAG: hypothetical protein A2104_09200 [Candidatus Melainabacteria bacterium GWF2_32_7]